MKAVLPVVVALLLSQSQQTAPTFLETLEVRITNVDVVVTDRDGKPVRGLRRDDFAVREDGMPQTITNFAEYGGSKGVAEAVPSAAPAPPPATESAAPQRKFLFYIDEMALTSSNRRQLIESSTALVRNEMRPGDEAMVITRANATKMPLVFTSDRTVLEKQLREALEQQTTFRANTGPQAEELFLKNAHASSPREYIQMARIYATRVNRRVTSTLRTLLGLVGSLNQTGGRKIVVVLSESLSSQPGREAFGLEAVQSGLAPTTQAFSIGADIAGELPSSAFDAADVSARASWFDVRPMVRELAARAGANGVTIYTLQPDFAGAFATPGPSADIAGRSVATRRGQTLRGTTFGVSQFHRMILEGTRETLQTLADDTGGKLFIGARELPGGFRQIAEDLTSYYSIGYRSEGGGDNSVRKIDVRVKNRPELTVRARRERLRRSPEREMDEIVAANLIAPRNVNELEIVASAGKPEHRIDSYRVPVVVKIPLGKLTFIPDGDKYRGSFTVHYAAADGADYTTGLFREQTLEIPAGEIDAARRKFFTYTSTLVVAPGTLKVAVGVYDRYSRLAGFQQLEVVAK